MPLSRESFGSAREAFRRLKKAVPEGVFVEPERWGIYLSTAKDYSKAFSGFVQDGNWDRFFQERKYAGRSAVCLDLASDGTALIDMSIDAGLAVGLSNVFGQKKDLLEQGKVETIAGNILEAKTWRMIDEWLKKQDTTSFDTVFFRPRGGIKYIGTRKEGKYSTQIDMEIFSVLISRIYEHLSPNGGELFWEVDLENKFEEGSSGALEMNTFVQVLNSFPGVFAETKNNQDHFFVFHLRKESGALPKLMFKPSMSLENK